MAYARLYALVQRQAAALAYVDVRRLLMIGAILAGFVALLLRSNLPDKGMPTMA